MRGESGRRHLEDEAAANDWRAQARAGVRTEHGAKVEVATTAAADAEAERSIDDDEGMFGC